MEPLMIQKTNMTMPAIRPRLYLKILKLIQKKDYITPRRNGAHQDCCEERNRAPLSAIGTICNGTTYIHSKM